MKNKLSKLYLFTLTTFFSFYFGAQQVFADQKNKVDTKYFGEDQDFWKNSQVLFGFLAASLIIFALTLTMIGMIWSAKRAASAKMQGNSQAFLKETKNYSKFVINIALMILIPVIIGLIFAWIIGFKTSSL